jgi:ribosomal protein S12 methylthiotransferase accessory factor YcaO
VKITLESTTRVVDVAASLSAEGVPGRVWEGKTESGVRVIAVVTLIAVPSDAGHDEIAAFYRELTEQRPPTSAAEQVFPLRMIL